LTSPLRRAILARVREDKRNGQWGRQRRKGFWTDYPLDARSRVPGCMSRESAIWTGGPRTRCATVPAPPTRAADPERSRDAVMPDWSRRDDACSAPNCGITREVTLEVCDQERVPAVGAALLHSQGKR